MLSTLRYYTIMFMFITPQNSVQTNSYYAMLMVHSKMNHYIFNNLIIIFVSINS